MSDIMRPIPFSNLMNWVLTEYRNQGSIFGVSKLVRHDNGKALPMFKEKIESPYGPAAGPHTQLAQNLIAAYAAGARFFELKTVQIMDGDELSKCVAKPCITAEDECYNCEWSTELYVPQAFDEYVKGWFACKLLAKELGLGDPDGFVFNMSVGYDLAGIKSEKIDKYIEGMKDASATPVWQECMDWALGNLDKFQNVDEAYVKAISPKVSDSITESTLHGCPPDEIERIATYLITEKNLNTYVKCNPTLLGYEFARKTLDGLGFDYIAFDDHHFVEDLQWADAVPMFQRLMKLTAERGLEFGVKLTNTFPVDVKAGELPSEEMYMSGRSLYPLSLSLAGKLAREFNGKLRISYSGGADYYNIKDLFDAGIWPITMATTVLKSGGYQRFSQIGNLLMDIPYGPWAGVDPAKVEGMMTAFAADGHYQKPMKPIPSRKADKKVPLIDCFSAPCRSGCPIEQDIPAYLMRVNAGKYEEALEIITHRNALPFITGTICSHRCQDKCMRNAYEESVYIRTQKLRAAEGGFDALLPKLKPGAPVAGKKVAVIGGGPAGMSAAYFLGRSGVDVTIFERKDSLGGIVRHVIPAFRISDAAIDNDVKLMNAMGVKVELNTEVKDVQELFKQGYTHVLLATGAWNKGSAGLEYGQEMNVIEFLEAAKKNPGSLNLGKHVVVIGGGNTAMDAARAAKRIDGVETVSLVYRRTKRYMPADQEELEFALEDGVEFQELLAPVGVKDGVLTCHVMELGAPDASGRRSPVDTGKVAEVAADTVITAVGEKVDTALYTANGLEVDKRGKAVVNADTLEASVKNVFVIGDGMKGPGTVVEAIADATKAARAIQDFDVDTYVDKNVNPDYNAPLAKRGELCADCKNSSEIRCLGCATVCETCTEVCPNRANVAVAVPGMRQRQIIHMDGMCNECGNCGTFCPYDSNPYKDKFTLFWSEEDFDNSGNQGFLKLNGTNTRVRLDGQVKEYDVADESCGLYDPIRRLICAVYDNYSYLLK
ncbi:putative selenate reductase subunit YgfK [Intestinimonas massiliensis (ex Afouda et al. 2020)]|uniref:putative selenate reductase subunit YgfK n=1 Tax=Intestinimonas massiliensis (ex Afouda et al. 2020) TaxID=1673721 RepID=UPI0010322CCD|nr:putative selenate reductase subunit YgfK [Intestinimonas massiliensis (ex Afouda et al. 2020)]